MKHKYSGGIYVLILLEIDIHKLACKCAHVHAHTRAHTLYKEPMLMKQQQPLGGDE